MPRGTRRILDAFPRGVVLTLRAWARRHPALLVVLAAHVPVFLLLGILTGVGIAHPAGGLGPVATLGLHGATALAVVIAILVTARFAERQARQKQRLWRELYEGERALVAALRAAEAVKAELIAVVSHEFRTPLTAIIGYTQLLAGQLDDLDPAVARQHLQVVDEQARRLSRIVQNVVAASGEIPIDREAITDLGVVTAEVAHDVGSLYDGAVDVHIVHLPDDLLAPVHEEAARRALTNVIDNAAKFAVAGTSVEIRGCRRGGRVEVEVANSARLPDERRRAIFEPFVQGDSSDSRRADGVGLGLPVARRLMQAHGGSLDLVDCGGAVMARIVLPAARVDDAHGSALEHLAG